MQIDVAPEKLTIKYLRAVTPDLETSTLHNGDVAFEYTLPEKKP